MTMRRKFDTHFDKQLGFTLIETLVAMVVLAVGMLGIAALYIEGLRSGFLARWLSDGRLVWAGAEENDARSLVVWTGPGENSPGSVCT